MPGAFDRTTFGNLPDGTPVDLITGRADGLEVRATNYGCLIVFLAVPDARGRADNVVLGYDRLERYLDASPYLGALVGRYANRIANARFWIEGRAYELSANEPPNHLHGGFKGFDKHVWQAETSETDKTIVFRRRSADGEEGYPGTLDVEVTYALDAGELRMTCEAVTDAPTHVNLTSHSYFNLAGGGDVLAHRLTIDADAFLPVDARLIPTGALAPVAGTPFDFRQPAAIGARLDDAHDQLRIGGGYDHNFVLNRRGGSGDPDARVVDESSGRMLEIRTTEPGLQFYSGQVVGHRGFCLEPQHYPDSPNRPPFPSTLLRPGQRYRTATRYTFST
jgi:aldose 1-epimerase